MYQNKITLSPQDILEKDFKIDTRVYRLKEVDQFLDVRNLKMKIEIADSSERDSYPVRENTNIDIMKRLSQLEKIVYGKEE